MPSYVKDYNSKDNTFVYIDKSMRNISIRNTELSSPNTFTQILNEQIRKEQTNRE